jgi:hypothetical protein
MSEENKNTEEKSAVGNQQLAENTLQEKAFPEAKNILAEQPQIEQSEIPVTIATTNTKPQTEEDMEVHHHTHPDSHRDHGKKTWKEYFWEFLMLFLAVFCGFLAEYQLEHTIEHQREKEFAKALYAELLDDSVAVANKLARRLEKEKDMDYLSSYFKDSSLILSCLHHQPLPDKYLFF